MAKSNRPCLLRTQPERSDAFTDLNPFAGDSTPICISRLVVPESTNFDSQSIILIILSYLSMKWHALSGVLAWNCDFECKIFWHNRAKTFSKCVNFYESGKKFGHPIVTE